MRVSINNFSTNYIFSDNSIEHMLNAKHLNKEFNGTNSSNNPDNLYLRGNTKYSLSTEHMF